MFDFDAGYYYYTRRGNYTIDSGKDLGQDALLGLSDQINNFMFLLATYFNFAAVFLNNLANINSDPTGQ